MSEEGRLGHCIQLEQCLLRDAPSWPLLHTFHSSADACAMPGEVLFDAVSRWRSLTTLTTHVSKPFDGSLVRHLLLACPGLRTCDLQLDHTPDSAQERKSRSDDRALTSRASSALLLKIRELSLQMLSPNAFAGLQLPKLRSLSLRTHAIRANFFELLQQLPNLCELSISICGRALSFAAPAAPAATVSAVDKLHELDALSLENVRHFDDLALSNVLRRVAVRELSLDDVALTDASLHVLTLAADSLCSLHWSPHQPDKLPSESHLRRSSLFCDLFVSMCCRLTELDFLSVPDCVLPQPSEKTRDDLARRLRHRVNPNCKCAKEQSALPRLKIGSKSDAARDWWPEYVKRVEATDPLLRFMGEDCSY